MTKEEKIQPVEIIVDCPHCQLPVLIMSNEINCAIFRHAIYKNTSKQINPHMPKDKCDNLFKTGRIIGCGKPFKLVARTDKEAAANYEAVECDYI